MPSMQEIDEAVLRLVKDSGKKLAHTIKTTKKVPPGPGVPRGQVIVNPVLLPLNTPAQCWCSIATAVPNGGPVVRSPPGPAQNTPAPPANAHPQKNAPPRAIPQAQLIPHPPSHIPGQIQQALQVLIPDKLAWVQHALANPQAQNNPAPPAIPQGQLIPHPPALIPAQIQQALPVFYSWYDGPGPTCSGDSRSPEQSRPRESPTAAQSSTGSE